jgi:hypothetical protein
MPSVASYSENVDRLDEVLALDRDETFVVIMGLAKSGTTLPLTLLDSHPDLLVLPEELRFFHSVADAGPGHAAAERLLSDSNMQQYGLDQRGYGTLEEEESVGRGVGARDYSDIDQAMFAALIKHCFANSSSPRRRYRGILYSYALAKGADPLGFDKFVSKAPHNEIYCRQWMAMLGDDGRYIYVHRSPAELFLSLRRVSALTGRAELSLDAFTKRYRLRAMMFDCLPSEQRFALPYEELVSHTEAVMRRVCSFAGVPFVSNVLHPTKNGVPWAGNSSRGIRSEAVFSNPEAAQKDLSPRSLGEIESRLCDVMVDLGRPVSQEVLRERSLRRQLDRVYCAAQARFVLSRLELIRSSPAWYRQLRGLRERFRALRRGTKDASRLRGREENTPRGAFRP